MFHTRHLSLKLLPDAIRFNDQTLFSTKPGLSGDSGVRRTGFRGEAEQRSGLIPNTFGRGIEVRLGDDLNGYLAEKTVRSASDIGPWLQEAIAHFLPDSDYARGLDSWVPSLRTKIGRLAGRSHKPVHF
jgi:hypothetical protein